ncbi:Transmembrane protein [Intoshia linei]|uniref:Transmembrane protein n=1 Tax=Intoshia linei TaxID=1819745 RepID=A0A177B1S3_9BILA|nr:Transmembrane protein [Intoshia linei]
MWWYPFILIGILFIKGSTKILNGQIHSKENWQFLSRFCFLSNKGQLTYEFNFNKINLPVNLLLYYDDPQQWPAVYNSDKSCVEKTSVLKTEYNQMVELSINETWSGCNETILYNTSYISCSGSRYFVSFRERWWYMAISNCDNPYGISLDYNLVMTNGNPEDTLMYHFSADEFYILQMDISFLVGFSILMILSFLVAYKLRIKQMFHSTYKLYMISIIFECIGLFILVITYSSFANEGHELRNVIRFGKFMEAISSTAFILLLILLGKGYTVTRGRLSNQGTIKCVIFITVYIVCYMILFFYEAYFFDPGVVLYIYESPPGYGLIILRIVAWLWFSYGIFFTLKNFSYKSNFYYPLFIFFTIWFLIGPVMVIVAMNLLPLWVREKVINGVDLSVSFLGLFTFLVLTRPSAANNNFPYHVKTTQIAAMVDTDEDNFQQYSPTMGYDGVNAPNFTELFVVTPQRSAVEKEQQNIDRFNRGSNGHNPFNDD